MNQDVVYELEALRAIYGDDFSDRPPVWNNPSFAIHIHPIGEQRQIFCRYSIGFHV